jgi:hypothetical protein
MVIVHSSTDSGEIPGSKSLPSIIVRGIVFGRKVLIVYPSNRFSCLPLYPELTVPLSLIHQLKMFMLMKQTHIISFVGTFSSRRME